MTPERWKKLEALFDEALEFQGEARSAHLAQACGDDEQLREEAERLIAAHEMEGSFIDSPILAETAGLTGASGIESLVGARIGPYQVISLLGRGGMGKVFLAEDIRLERKVALKILPAAFIQNPDRVRRFEREAKAASALNHPNILTIHEIGEADGAHYIVSEFVEGETLRERMRRETLSLTAALDVARQVAGALAAAHSAGIMHRDIKPENVMVRPDGLVKVLDFGLAKLMERPAATPKAGGDSQPPTVAHLSTEPGAVMGTVSYMSPEQARGLKVDHRTDIFSLGVMFYEMLAGRRPFEGASSSDVIAALLTSEPAPLRSVAPQASAELERIAEKCLAKDPEARYQSAKELVAELKTLRYGIQAKESATTSRIAGTQARSASWLWPLFAATAALLIVGLVWFFSWRRAPAVQPDQIKSLAVLPLENLSGDPAHEYFADGMTEALINNLAQIRALRVISRTSVMRFKGSHKSLTEIAQELNVDAVIEGSVQRASGRLKIMANLIHASTETRLWTGAYERELTDVLKLQSEVAQTIIQEIQIKLTSQEKMRLASAHPINPTAYDDYLRGRFYANRQNKADNETAIMTLERAVAIDPTFAAAHAELAQAYVWRFFLYTPKEKQWEVKAFVAVEKSLSLDPDSADAHLARGRFLWTPANHFPHEKAIQECRRALILNPTLDEAQNQLALVYNHIGAFDHALQELRQAVAINPTNSQAQFRIGQTLLFQGKYEQALTALRNIPKEANPRVGYHRAMALLHLGRREEAAAIAEEFIAEYPEDADGGLLTCFQALLAALAGEKNKAEVKIRSAIEKGRGFGHFHHTAYDIACAYSLMKKAEPAIKWLQVAADDGFPCYPLFENDPYLDNLRKDPRFIALMTKLKEQWEYYRTRL